MQYKKEKVKNLPDAPGVYYFKSGKDILYIGKATSLRSRVQSYFTPDIRIKRSPLIEKMVEESDDIEVTQTDSVLEAFILESNLIKQYQPTYNSKDKDGKSFNYVAVTKEEYPRVFTVRGGELQTTYDPDDFKYLFGPYPSGGSLKIALKIIRKIFPFKGKKDTTKTKKKQSRLNIEIGIVPDFESVSKKEYSNTIRNIKLFFEGKKKKILTLLQKEMKEYAKKQDFEKAEEIKRQIFALEHINDVALISDRDENSAIRIEGYDVAHISGSDMVGVMVVLEGGFLKKSDYRKFNIKSVSSSNDTAALKEVLERRLKHDEWQLPRLIVVDGGKAQINIAEKVIDSFGYQIPVVSVVKNEKHQPRELLGKKENTKEYEKEILMVNNEAHRFALSFHQQKRSQTLRK